MCDLLNENELFEYEIEIEEAIYQWFKKNLDVPYVQSSNSNYYSKPLAISWFKDTAVVHVQKMREYIHILESHDVRVKQLTTDKPGKIVYEDEYQVAAVPFGDTFK